MKEFGELIENVRFEGRMLGADGYKQRAGTERWGRKHPEAGQPKQNAYENAERKEVALYLNFLKDYVDRCNPTAHENNHLTNGIYSWSIRMVQHLNVWAISRRAHLWPCT